MGEVARQMAVRSEPIQGTAEEANEAMTRAAKMTIRLELDGVN